MFPFPNLRGQQKAHRGPYIMQHVRCQQPVPRSSIHSSSKIIQVPLILLLFFSSCSSTHIICAKPCSRVRSNACLQPVVIFYPSFCVKATVRPNKWKCWHLEQRKVYCRGHVGVQAARPYKTQTPWWISGEFLKARWGRKSRECNQLLHHSLIGWGWDNRVRSQGLISSVLRFQLVWVLPA